MLGRIVNLHRTPLAFSSAASNEDIYGARSFLQERFVRSNYTCTDEFSRTLRHVREKAGKTRGVRSPINGGRRHAWILAALGVAVTGRRVPTRIYSVQGCIESVKGCCKSLGGPRDDSPRSFLPDRHV